MLGQASANLSCIMSRSLSCCSCITGSTLQRLHTTSLPSSARQLWSAQHRCRAVFFLFLVWAFCACHNLDTLFVMYANIPIQNNTWTQHRLIALVAFGTNSLCVSGSAVEHQRNKQGCTVAEPGRRVDCCVAAGGYSYGCYEAQMACWQLWHMSNTAWASML